MSNFVNFTDVSGDKKSILASVIAYIHWGGVDEDGDLVPTSIHILGRKNAIADIDHRDSENNIALSKIIPGWESQVFTDKEEN
jgi:hypothetical protein